MNLYVTDPEAYRHAQSIAAFTGVSLTEAVTEALRERYERVRPHDREALADELLAIGKRASTHLKQPYIDHAEFLYDEHGLPK